MSDLDWKRAIFKLVGSEFTNDNIDKDEEICNFLIPKVVDSKFKWSDRILSFAAGFFVGFYLFIMLGSAS